MKTPILKTHIRYYIPRPDRLYRQFMFRKHHTRIERDILQDVLDEYGLHVRGKLEVTGGRSENIIVETNAGKKMLKRYKDTLIPEALVHEHSILNYLAQINFPAPHLTSTVCGESLIQKEGRSYALFDFLEGYFQYHNYFLVPAQAQQFISVSGKALGALHTTLRDFSPAGYHPNGCKSRKGDRWRELSWFTDKLDWCRQELPNVQADDADVLSRMLSEDAGWVEETLHSLNDSIKAAELPCLIIHGDYGPYNLFFKRGAPTIILDFELARLDWRLADLAMALPFFADGRLGFNFNKMNYFLEAYRSECPLDSAELRFLPTVWQFLTLRRVIFCWYRYCNTPSRRWLREAQQKLKLFHWLTEHQNTLHCWLT